MGFLLVPRSVGSCPRQWWICYANGAGWVRRTVSCTAESSAQMVGKRCCRWCYHPYCITKYWHCFTRSMGTKGVERTTELVRQRCYWPGLTLDVVQCVKSVTGARPPTTGKSVYTIAPVDDLGRVRCVNRPALFPLSQALDNYFNTLVVFSGREFYWCSYNKVYFCINTHVSLYFISLPSIGKTYLCPYSEYLTGAPPGWRSWIKIIVI